MIHQVKICDEKKWVCPHIVNLDKSVKDLAEWVQLIVEQISSWNITHDAEQILTSLQLNIPIEELKSLIQSLSNEIISKQNIMIQKIQTLQENIEELEKDHLTWVYTRHRYQRDFWNLKQSLIEKKSPFSCAVIDIDNFKIINDTYSHLWWDNALKYLTEILKLQFWDQCIYRYGGEEFIILYKWNKEKLYKWLSKVLDFLNQKNIKRSINFSITFSWWITECKIDDSYESIFQRADELMYKAKRNGKNQIYIK